MTLHRMAKRTKMDAPFKASVTVEFNDGTTKEVLLTKSSNIEGALRFVRGWLIEALDDPA